MLLGGFELAERLLGFPRPVVMACTGHALAMGSFLLCAGDYRVGAAGDFKLQANEVAIGLTMPLPAVAILRYRLAPSAFDRAVGLAEVCHPADAVAAGWLDRVVDPDEVVSTSPRRWRRRSLASTLPPTTAASAAPGRAARRRPRRHRRRVRPGAEHDDLSRLGSPPSRRGYRSAMASPRRPLDEQFDGNELDPAVWLPYYLPHWSSRAASAATGRSPTASCT